jgi:hypothetical protein
VGFVRDDEGVEMSETVWVVGPKWSAMTEKIEKLNRRAEKLGVEPLSVVKTGETRTVEEKDSVTGTVVYSWEEIEVSVEGGLPKLDGYSLRAVIEHEPMGLPDSNFVTVISGESDPAWRTAPGDCDHCGMKRRRKMTLIVESDGGEIVTVGSTCVKDFLGWWGNPVSWAEWLAAAGNLDEYTEGGGTDHGRDPSTAGVVTMTSAVLRKLPFVKASSEFGIPTKDLVADLLAPPSKFNEYARREAEEAGVEVTEADRAVIDELREWAEAEKDRSDYAWNVYVATAAKEFSARKLGIVVSAVHVLNVARDRAKLREIEKAEAGPVPTGKGVEIEGVIVSRKIVDNGYGPTTKIVVRLDNGSRVWGSAAKSIDGSTGWDDEGQFVIEPADVGDTVRFVANVEPSDDDDFGFFKRPRKAEIVARAAADTVEAS